MITKLLGAARFSWRLLALVLLCMAWTPHAHAGELVILVQPKSAGPELREAFNRLHGELTLHGFEVEVVTADETVSSASLSERADRQKAIASVSFESRKGGDGIEKVDIWISDRVTGKTTTQTIKPRDERDAATVLSVRALELLRASLREFAVDEPEVEIAGAHPERASAAVTEIRFPPPPKRTVTFGVGAAIGWSTPNGSDTYGPEFTAGYLSGAFGVRAFGLGPFQGGRINSSIGTVAYNTFHLGLEPLLFPIRSPRWTLGFFPSVGAAHLEVRGEVGAPFRGTEDRGWLFTAGGGGEGAVRLSRAIEIYVCGRGFWLLPSPVVTLGSEKLTISSPGFSVSLGIRFSPG